MVSGPIKGDDFKVSTIDMLPGWLHFMTFPFITEYYHFLNIRCAIFLISSNLEVNLEQGPFVESFAAWFVSVKN